MQDLEYLHQVAREVTVAARVAPDGEIPGVGKNTTGYAIASVLMALISLVFYPPLFGAGAIMCGYKVKTGGNEALGIGLMVLSAACMAIGTKIVPLRRNAQASMMPSRRLSC